MRALRGGEAAGEGPAHPPFAARKLGNAENGAGVGDAQMALPGLWPQLLVALPRHPAALACDRDVPA
ncbi:MAG TPA: hypothetical protein VH601_16350 [Bryobacteraceae bacterium]